MRAVRLDRRRDRASHTIAPTARLVGLTCLALIATGGLLNAQSRASFFDEPSEFVLPVNYDDSGSHPLVVVVPYTNGTAREAASLYFPSFGNHEDFILMLPPGRAGTQHYLPNFTAFVQWYEARVLADIEVAKARYAVDATRIYLAGYSLGGDLSWALSVRNPAVFAGAVIGGARSSYPATPEALDALGRSGFRAAFMIGNRDDRVRIEGIRAAHQTLGNAGIETVYNFYPGDHLVMPGYDLWSESVEFVSGGTWQAVAPRVASAPGRSTGGASSPRTATAARGQPAGALRRASSERLAFGAYLPWQTTTSGVITFSDLQHLYIRTEIQSAATWTRSKLAFSTSGSSTDADRFVTDQTVAFTYGRGAYLIGAQLGWDWASRVRASGEMGDGMTKFRIGAVGVLRGTNRANGVATLMYRIPWSGFGFVAPNVFNAELDVIARLGSRFVLGASAATYAAQNAPGTADTLTANNLDHVLEYSLRVGFRAPIALLWTVGLTHVGYRAVDSGDSFSFETAWRIGLEYSR